ncbi:hypothetical protein CIRMBP1204_01709 [Enterococcus cecorum]|nr:hypothetical protein CIRMBP1204_01709 [Enterococcus cecorum]
MEIQLLEIRLPIGEVRTTMNTSGLSEIKTTDYGGMLMPILPGILVKLLSMLRTTLV